MSQYPARSGGSGGNISLTAFHPDDSKLVLLSNKITATVLGDDAEVYALYLNRGDTVKVTEFSEEITTL